MTNTATLGGDFGLLVRFGGRYAQRSLSSTAVQLVIMLTCLKCLKSLNSRSSRSFNWRVNARVEVPESTIRVTCGTEAFSIFAGSKMRSKTVLAIACLSISREPSLLRHSYQLVRR